MTHPAHRASEKDALTQGHTSIDGQREGPTKKTGRFCTTLRLHPLTPCLIMSPWDSLGPVLYSEKPCCPPGPHVTSRHTLGVLWSGFDFAPALASGRISESDKDRSRRAAALTGSVGSLGCSTLSCRLSLWAALSSAFLGRSLFSCRCFCGYSPATQLSMFL